MLYRICFHAFAAPAVKIDPSAFGIDQRGCGSGRETESAEEVFNSIVPEYLAGLVYGAVCDSVASELAARRTAMEAATDNAEEMIEKLNLYYNRARQASITQEITEIVGGAEGLTG